MVIESLISIKSFRNPLIPFFYSAIISIISVYVSFLIFKGYEGFFVTFFITISLIPFFRKLVYLEIKRTFKGRNIIERFRDVIYFYIVVLLGIVFGLSILYSFLPKEISEQIFQYQIKAIERIRGSFVANDIFLKIFVNNFSVLTLSFILSIIFGFGALLIICWNATVLATAIGMLVKNYGITFFPQAFLIFLPHGILEFIAYFLAGIAGAMLSSASVKFKYSFSSVFFIDSFKIYLLSILILLIAAIVETLALI
ncbi:MAG: stage II sporulation protein M [Candidatus Aenigmatarchaeota archaeon]